MDVGLVGLGLFRGEATEFGEKTRSDADRDPLPRVAARRMADAVGAAKLAVTGFWNIGKV